MSSQATQVTVVPVDSLILVNGEPLRFDFPAPADMHALQWYGGGGHVEGVNGSFYKELAAEDYEKHVAPFVALWQAEKARLTAEAEAAEAARLAEYNSEPARFECLRAERDARIAATDYLMTADYPLTDEQRADVTAYRQALRDLPSQDGAPWDGGGEATPWPALPVALAVKLDDLSRP